MYCSAYGCWEDTWGWHAHAHTRTRTHSKNWLQRYVFVFLKCSKNSWREEHASEHAPQSSFRAWWNMVGIAVSWPLSFSWTPPAITRRFKCSTLARAFLRPSHVMHDLTLWPMFALLAGEVKRNAFLAAGHTTHTYSDTTHTLMRKALG